MAFLTMSGSLVARAQSAEESAIIGPVASYGLDSGRFTVVAMPGVEGRRLARLAELAWEVWTGPLALPSRAPNGVTVRLVSDAVGALAERGWRVAAEPGGLVTVWIAAGGEGDLAQERRWLSALAAGGLQRRAQLLRMAPERVRMPEWLLAAAAEAVLIRENPALLDAWRQEMRGSGAMPALRGLLLEEVAAERAAAFGVWLWLQAESGRGTGWASFVTGLLGGEAPGAALARCFATSLAGADAREIELAWQVAAAGLARAQATPMWEAAETRRLLLEADRWVAGEGFQPIEEVRTLSGRWLERNDPQVNALREARLAWLSRSLPRVHIFYRNAAVSLGRAWLATAEGDATAWSGALEDYRRDLETGRALEQASRQLLDTAER